MHACVVVVVGSGGENELREGRGAMIHETPHSRSRRGDQHASPRRRKASALQLLEAARRLPNRTHCVGFSKPTEIFRRPGLGQRVGGDLKRLPQRGAAERLCCNGTTLVHRAASANEELSPGVPAEKLFRRTRDTRDSLALAARLLGVACLLSRRTRLRASQNPRKFSWQRLFDHQRAVPLRLALL